MNDAIYWTMALCAICGLGLLVLLVLWWRDNWHGVFKCGGKLEWAGRRWNPKTGCWHYVKRCATCGETIYRERAHK